MKRVVACCLLLALAACGGAPQKPAPGNPAPTAKPAPAKPAAVQAQPAPVEQPAPVQSAAKPPQPQQPEPEEKVAPVEPEIPVNDDPGQFMSASDADLRQALGDPALIRRDGPAEVWQYRGDTCTLDLFLYPGGASALSVKHVELRGEDARRACLARMIRAHIVAADG